MLHHEIGDHITAQIAWFNSIYLNKSVRIEDEFFSLYQEQTVKWVIKIRGHIDFEENAEV